MTELRWIIAKTYSVDVVCDLFYNGVSILLSSEVTNCCSVNFGFAILFPFIFPVVIAFLCFMHFIESTMWIFHILWWNVPCNLPLNWYASLLECEWLQNFIQWMLFCDMFCNGVSILLSSGVTNCCSINFDFAIYLHSCFQHYLHFFVGISLRALCGCFICSDVKCCF